jgi:hypothetical protein
MTRYVDRQSYPRLIAPPLLRLIAPPLGRDFAPNHPPLKPIDSSYRFLPVVGDRAPVENYQSGIAPDGAIIAGRAALFSAAFALQRELMGMPSLNRHHQTRLEAPGGVFRL